MRRPPRIIAAALALVAMSCGAASANDIAGARWRVAELGGEAVSNAGALEIHADRITGREACNRIAARYTAADGRLTVGPVRHPAIAFSHNQDPVPSLVTWPRQVPLPHQYRRE